MRNKDPNSSLNYSHCLVARVLRILASRKNGCFLDEIISKYLEFGKYSQVAENK